MAELFWLRGNAAGRHETSPPHHLAIDLVEEKLVPFEKVYFDEPPDLDPERFAHDDDWHVFVRINDEETDGVFPEQGYYEVVNVTPDDCRQLFRL
jgi:hypothetical protein